MIQKETIQFLQEIKINNNKPWFTENKARYLKAKENFNELFLHLTEQLNKTDKIEEYKIYRVYRDVRFSKDKTPYKTNLSGYFKRLGMSRRGSYWISLESDGTAYAGGGFYQPNKEDLFRIRKEFELDDVGIRKILNHKNFKSTFGELQGDRVKTAPKGFSKEHSAIDLIRMKGFYGMKQYSKKEVLSKEFPDLILQNFKHIRPFFDYMSDVLTTNLNGESIL